MKLRTLSGLLGGAITLVLLVAEFPRSLTLHAAEDTSPRDAITSVLTEQQTAWNRGDVNAFMKGYWDSPELTFAGTSGITRGWQPVLARYLKNYPDQKAMGHLDFSDMEVHTLGEDAALVLGRWHLQRDTGELGGVFTLVFQHFPEGWKIIHDHTSLDAKEP
ncbi:MAG: nuclear transport factor 2 family protein [Candidatus Acidiferrum sp.]